MAPDASCGVKIMYLEALLRALKVNVTDKSATPFNAFPVLAGCAANRLYWRGMLHG